jgi:virulence factor Mce-like protein
MALLRKAFGVLVVTAAAIGLFIALGGASDERGKRYWVELDNAFGLTEGADVKVAGVRAGKVKRFKLDREDMRALVSVELNRGGFDDLRSDVRCETRPQSLIGEYFIDCRPGTSRKRLPDGATIPVEQTETTIPLDLVNNIMRRPYRERFTILLSELGAGLAARGEDLDATIRRAVPALRQVDRLLAILRDQRRTIRDLYRDADQVMVRVADKRDEVGRFVDEARDTTAAASLEDAGIREQWRTFPTFLRELRPTLARLEATADEQIPALQNLNRAAPALEQLFDTLGPYADASRPAVRSLADAAEVGRGAVRATTAPVAELRKGVDDLPEASKNLAITFDHLDDPKFATEKDPRGGRKDGGFTGLEALIRYFFAQSQAINAFDANSYMLKASLFLDRACANYATVKEVKDGTAPARCRAWLGPNQPGITSADPTKTATRRAARDTGGERREGDADRPAERRTADTPSGEQRAGEERRADTPKRGGGPVPLPKLDELLDELPKLPELPSVPSVPDVKVPDVRAPDVRTPDVRSPEAQQGLLDFLLGS